MAEQAGSQRYTMPSYNSQGEQVWDPSVGLYFTPGANNAESYGGVVTAIQDQIKLNGSDQLKAFPYNFAGIISALQALTVEVDAGPAAEIGDSPEEITNPIDGTLWFDTRQGRLFVAFDNEWYQTNGADGLPIVTDNNTPPSSFNLPNGQFWWDAANNSLYIFEGTFRDSNGEITIDPADAVSPVWILIADGNTGMQTTANLPLVNIPDDPDGFNSMQRRARNDTRGIIPAPDYDTLLFQEQANLYLYDCISALDTEVENQQITMSPDPPLDPVSGQLWFDTNQIELSIWYKDEDGGQWVPTYANFMVDAEISSLSSKIVAEANARADAIAGLQTEVDGLESTVATQGSSLNSLSATVATLPTNTTLEAYAIEAEQQGHIANLQRQINSNDGDISAIHNNYMTSVLIDTKFRDMSARVDALPTQSDLTAVDNKIVPNAATTTYVDNKVATVQPGIPAAGGTITGSLKLQSLDVAIPVLDYTGSATYGRVAQKYQTYCQMTTPHYATFGTTNKLFEYAWDFTSNEDFCYKSNGTKVASIDRNGIAATALKIATFGANTSDGRQLLNTIDIGDTLSAIKSAVSASSDYATLKSGLINALVNV